MKTAPIPKNEDERLVDLRALKLLDTPPEQRFDRLVGLAASMFETPIAYIALVDVDRQWFKAKVGLDVEQTGRAESFCGHTILQDDALVIPDTREDKRFHDNPMVTGDPGLRFYAGHPLKGPYGRNIGTLCIADTHPHEFDQRATDLLTNLARLVEHELSLVDLIGTQRELLTLKDDLMAVQGKLAAEATEAAEYVESLLPTKLVDGPVRTDYRFHASSQLGGDLLGYHWLDRGGPNHLAMYVIDVCGHGVGASLMSASAWTALRRGTLTDCEFCRPATVLSAMNEAFPMDENHGKFLTGWYGVYDVAAKTLRFASGGHPPAVLIEPGQAPKALTQGNLALGIEPNIVFTDAEIPIAPNTRIYVFTDGVFEVRRDDGEMIGYEGFVQLLGSLDQSAPDRVAEAYRRVAEYQGHESFEDDFTLLELTFPQ